MRRDSIVRKIDDQPMFSAAIVVERGNCSGGAVSRIYPFGNVKVGTEKVDAAGNKSLELVPVRRAMTVQDLLRHTSGLTYGFFGDSLVKKAYVDAGIGISGDVTTADFVDKLATMPLHYQPGSTWDYSYSTDVLGRVLEVVSGKPLGVLLKERLFDPLGMKDTSFYVPESARQTRIAEPWPDDRTIGANATLGDPRVVQKLESGGGGLVSTAPDYSRFLQMMASGGTLDGRRYISPKTLEYMTRTIWVLAWPPPLLPSRGRGTGFWLASCAPDQRGVAFTHAAANTPGVEPAGLTSGSTRAATVRRFMMQSPSSACRTARSAQHGVRGDER